MAVSLSKKIGLSGHVLCSSRAGRGSGIAQAKPQHRATIKVAGEEMIVHTHTHTHTHTRILASAPLFLHVTALAEREQGAPWWVVDRP